MDTLTISDFQTALVVLLALFSAFAVLDKGVASIRNIFFKGSDDLRMRVKANDERLRRGTERIDAMDERIQRMDEDMSHVLTAMNSILMHEITGNNIDRLKESKQNLDTYMARRGTSSPSIKN